jgi:hypothetical protein
MVECPRLRNMLHICIEERSRCSLRLKSRRISGEALNFITNAIWMGIVQALPSNPPEEHAT